MKSLLDIQQDIRDLELSAKEITKSIRSLHTDIENIRDSSDIAELDYARIEMLSRQLPFGKHPLNKLEDRTCCKIYLEMLLNIVCLDLESENQSSCLSSMASNTVKGKLDIGRIV